jgi:hypothetical protein
VTVTKFSLVRKAYAAAVAAGELAYQSASGGMSHSVSSQGWQWVIATFVGVFGATYFVPNDQPLSVQGTVLTAPGPVLPAYPPAGTSAPEPAVSVVPATSV